MFSLLTGNGGLSKQQIDDDITRHPFSDWLPWVAYDEENQRFLNVDNTWGYLWECIPHAFTTPREIKVLEGLLSQTFPKNANIQFILYADENIEGFLQRFKKTKIRQDPIIQKSVEELTRFYQKGVKGLNTLNGIPLRNFRSFICIKTEDALASDFLSNIEDSLHGARLAPYRMGPEDLLAWMRNMFNGSDQANPRSYNPLIPLRKQILNAETVVQWQSNKEQVTRIGKRFARCITPKLLPDSCDIMQTNHLVGAIMGCEEDNDQINAPFMWCVNILPTNVKADIHTKATFMMAQRSIGSFAAKLEKRVEEISWALKAIEREKFVKIIPTLWVFGDSEEKTRDALSRAKRIWENQNYAMQEEAKIARPLFIASLPFGLYNTRNNIRFMERDFPVPVSVAVRMLPCQADFRGTSSAVLGFAGRKGQVIGVDVFDERVNSHNFVIAASTGSGKTFTLNYICSNYYGSGAMVRLIDIGYGYKKLCNLFKGRYLDFGRERICINPFHSIGIDQEDRENDLQATANVIAEMVYSASGQHLAETEWTLIKDAVQWAIQRDGGEYGIDHVYEYLAKYPQHVADKDQVVDQIIKCAKIMAFNLRDFISKGRYGRFFNGKSSFDINSDEFVVLELEKLKGQMELFKVVTMQVANACTQDLYLSDRNQRRFILFEEAYQFLKLSGDSGNARIGGIIEEGYRRARKYQGSFGIVTQSLMDLKSFGAAGPVILSNSDFRFLLEAKDYKNAVSDKLVDYQGLALDILTSVKNNKPKYSEIFFDTPLGMGVGRLVVDPWTYWVNTSTPAEANRYIELTKKGYTPLAALDYLSGQ